MVVVGCWWMLRCRSCLAGLGLGWAVVVFVSLVLASVVVIEHDAPIVNLGRIESGAPATAPFPAKQRDLHAFVLCNAQCARYLCTRTCKKHVIQRNRMKSTCG